MFANLLLLTLFLLGIATLIAMYRLIKGTTISDRVLALDAIGINIIAIVAVLCIYLDTRVFLDIILMVGILSFLGTVALCKFIERGVVIDDKRDD